MELMEWVQLIFTVACAFLLTYMAIPAIIRISHLKKLSDNGGSERKLHLHATPNLGGIAIFLAVFIAFSLSGFATASWAPYLAAGMTILLFSGIKDDILVISALKKFLLQMAAVAALVVGGGQVVTDLGGVFGLHSISLWAGLPLTFFTMIVVVNAYNLIDGIDGLAGGIGVMASLFFGWWFWQVDMMTHAALSLTVASSLVAFLWFNFQPASIFMGDTGSQIVGLLLAFFAVSFVNAGVAGGADVVAPFQESVPVLVLAVLIVPLYDTLRVFILRLAEGRSPFSPDRLHVHHQLQDIGFSHRTCCYIIFSFNAIVVGLTMLMHGMEVNMLFGFLLFTTVLLFPTINLKRNLLAWAGIELPSVSRVKVIERMFGTTKRIQQQEKAIEALRMEGEREKRREWLNLEQQKHEQQKEEREYNEIAV